MNRKYYCDFSKTGPDWNTYLFGTCSKCNLKKTCKWYMWFDINGVKRMHDVVLTVLEDKKRQERLLNALPASSDVDE